MRRSLIIITAISLVLIPLVIYAQQATTNAPPIEQPLVREGDFAVELVKALNLGTTSDETEAETTLGSNGITPRNGWIADYPVTPDILDEIRNSVIDAADSNKIGMGRDGALKAFQDAKADLDLEVKHYTPGESHEVNPSSGYPETSTLNTYYYDQGPPIVTYYSPPPDYYYLYSWVPYPFWWYDFWFPGFFILNDFHRVTHFHKRTCFVSNHFNDVGHHRVFRIDPVNRFHGRTFAGIGAPKAGHFLSTGVKGGNRSIFNRNRITPPSGGRSFTPPSHGRSSTPPPGGRSVGPPSGGRSFSAPSGGRSFAPPSSGRSVSPPYGGRSFSPPSGGRSVPPPSGGRSSSPPYGGR